MALQQKRTLHARTLTQVAVTTPKQRRHIALVGFAGSGKTTIGQILAKNLGLEFIDLDDIIAREADQPITALFRDQGEVAFRARERATLRDVLSREQPMVLATGGSTFVDASMRRWIQEAARTVFLHASADALASRITASHGRAQRPLLTGPDPVATISRLLTERSGAYGQADVVVHTDGRTLQDVVSDIARSLRRDTPEQRSRHDASPAAAIERTPQPAVPRAAAEPGTQGTTLTVEASAGAYAIDMRPSAGSWLAERISALSDAVRVAIVSDTTVAPLHAHPLVEHLRERGKQVTLHTVEPGEGSKSLETAGSLYDALLEAGLTRTDTIVAVGGGVVGDLTGFVASTLLRGIPYVQVPTTTLAAVDSSVGGKTAVNTRRGKNLVGTFYAPKAVLLAVDHLATQSRRAHAAGLVEAVKMAATMDARLFADIVAAAPRLLAFDATVLLPILARAVGLKAAIVARDEREAGDRAVLNYGHTIGHAIEAGEQYTLLHGEAVALGMLAECEWAEAQGWGTDLVATLESALQALAVPIAWRDYRIDRAALGLDKKRSGAGVCMPIIPALGTFELRTVPMQSIVAFLGTSTGMDAADVAPDVDPSGREG